MTTSGRELAGGVAAGSVRRVLSAEITRARRSSPARPPRVLDVGGGSGAWAVPLAVAGCAVTVVDASPDALATLVRRAREAGVAELVTPVQGYVDALADVVAPSSADLVLGHGLLEVVDDPARAVAALTAATVPGGGVSVLVAARYAAVLARVLAGRLVEARILLADPEGRLGEDDALRRRLDVAGLRGLLESRSPDGSALRIEVLRGDGILDAWVPGSVRDGGPAASRAIADLEELAGAAAPLREVAARLHALARRTPREGAPQVRPDDRLAT